MTGPRIEELINKEIDGVATPEETAALQAELASDDEAQGYYRDLQKLSGMLDAVPMVDPPPGLKPEIMRQVRARAAHRHREGWLRGFLRGFSLRPRPAYALSFASGLAMGVLVFALLSGGLTPPHMDRSRATGTLAPLPAPTELSVIDRAQIAERGFRGVATTRAGDGRVMAELELSAGGKITAVVEFDPDQLRPLGVEPGTSARIEAMLDRDRVRVTHFGEGRYHLHWTALADGNRTIRIRLTSGEEVWEGTLRTAMEASPR